MTEKDSEKEAFKKDVEAIKAAWDKKPKQDARPLFETANTARDNTAEALDKKLRSMASENKAAMTDRFKPAPAPVQEIFKVQEKVAGTKSAGKTIALTLLAVLMLAGIGYPTKLAYEGKLEVQRLSKDYKLLQVTLNAINKRNYALYKKIFPQVEELQSSRMDSALKGIEDNLDLAVTISAEADNLWNMKKYDQAMDLYDRASKINPLNNRSAYLAKEAELAKEDQASFRRFYIVKAEDTLESIAKRAKISALRIMNANGPKYTMLYQGRLVKGMQLALPVNIERANKK